MKQCILCKEIKSLDNYWVRRDNKIDGHRSSCKDCDRRKFRECRKNNPENYQAKDKRYYVRHSKEKIRKVQEYRNNYPDKTKAHDTTKYAIQTGKLTPQLCACGGIGEAHHEDYNKPLDIEWLCKPCHRRRHGLTK